jgi:hypothetical protein
MGASPFRRKLYPALSNEIRKASQGGHYQGSPSSLGDNPQEENDPRLFTYTLLGFSGSFDKFIERHKLDKFRFHFFRREAISNLVFNIGQITGMDGANFSILISELLGIENVRTLERTISVNCPLLL